MFAVEDLAAPHAAWGGGAMFGALSSGPRPRVRVVNDFSGDLEFWVQVPSPDGECFSRFICQWLVVTSIPFVKKKKKSFHGVKR